MAIWDTAFHPSVREAWGGKQRPYTKEKCSCLPTHAASVSEPGVSVLCSYAWPLPPPGATGIKPMWICSAVCLRRLHSTTVRVLRICISMTKLRWTWLSPSHGNLLKNRVVRNALPRSQRQCQYLPHPPPRLHSRGEDAKVHPTGPVPHRRQHVDNAQRPVEKPVRLHYRRSQLLKLSLSVKWRWLSGNRPCPRQARRDAR